MHGVLDGLATDVLEGHGVSLWGGNVGWGIGDDLWPPRCRQASASLGTRSGPPDCVSGYRARVSLLFPFMTS